MNKIKYSFLTLALCAGITSIANAHLVLDSTFDISGPGGDSPQHTLEVVQARFNQPDLFNCIDRVDGGQNFVGDGFVVTFNNDNSATITWANLSDIFFGVYVKGGSNGGNFYTVTSDELSSGSSTVFAANNKNGRPARISHIDFFCLPGATTVPDGGTTAMLLGTALTGLGLARRFIKR